MPTISENFVKDITSDERVVITGVEVVLTNEIIDPGRDLVVRADHLSIAAGLAPLPGRRLHLFAREIHASDGARLDVSGASGNDGEANIDVDRSPGETGAPGGAGEVGGAGGEIVLITDALEGQLELVADGGGGGAGGDGGDGMVGRTGPAGRRDQNYRRRGRANGSPGGQGGDGGRAGRPGDGGHGGRITVRTAESSASLIEARAAGGSSGAPGTNGNPGGGGPGGSPGTWIEIETYSCGPQGDFECEREIPRRGRRGPNGVAGNEADPAPNGAAGAEGTVSIESIAPGATLKARQLTLLLGRMVLRQAVVDHLNRDVGGASARLTWLFQLLSASTERCDHRGLLAVESPQHAPWGDDDEEFDLLRTSASIQIKRIELGLDAYGNPPTFVPMLSYQSYRDYVERWLEAAERAETLHRQYSEREIAHELRMGYLDRALVELALFIEQLVNDAQVLEDHRLELAQSIGAMLARVQRRFQVLQEAGDEFKDAVKRKANQCDFGEVLKAAASIGKMATGVGMVGGGIEELLGSLDELEKDERGKLDFRNYFKTIAKKAKPVEGGFDKVSKGYQELRELLVPEPGVSLPTDQAKILMSREDLEETLKPFKDLPEAEAYLRAVDEFIEVVTARNGLILEHDALVVQLEANRVEVQAARDDVDDMREQRADESDPDLGVFQDFMDRTLDRYKTECLRSLYYANRGLAYLTLKPAPVVYGRNRTVEELRAISLELYRRLNRASEQTGRAHQLLELGHPSATFSLASLLGAARFEALRGGDVVDFRIPTAALEDWFHVYVTRVRASFVASDSSETTGALRLVHSGHASFVTSDRQHVTFAHAPRVTTVFDRSTGSDQGASLGGSDDEFIKLSPAGPWFVDLALQVNEGIDFSVISDVVLEFELRYLTHLA